MSELTDRIEKLKKLRIEYADEYADYDPIVLLIDCQSEIERLERENERLQRWKKLLEDAPGESKDSIRTRCLETDYIQPIVGEWRKKVERLERQLEAAEAALRLAADHERMRLKSRSSN